LKVEVDNVVSSGLVNPIDLKSEQEIGALSPDKSVGLTVPEGTVARTMDGSRLEMVTATPMKQGVDMPTMSSNISILSQVVKLGPEGAIFSKPIALTLRYDPSKLEPGVSEEDLLIFHWNGSSWDSLQGTIDTEQHTITVWVTQILSPYTILAEKEHSTSNHNWIWIVIMPEILVGLFIFGATRKTRLVLQDVPVSIRANEISSLITVELRHPLGWRQRVKQDTTIAISSSSLVGYFDANADGKFSGDVDSVDILRGENRASFYYRDSSLGTPTITVKDASGRARLSRKQLLVTGDANPFIQPGSATITWLLEN